MIPWPSQLTTLTGARSRSVSARNGPKAEIGSFTISLSYSRAFVLDFARCFGTRIQMTAELAFADTAAVVHYPKLTKLAKLADPRFDP